MKEVSEVAKASARGSFFLFLGMTSSNIILAITSILVARLLSPEKYGLYNVVLIIPSFLIILSDFGISSGLTRFSAKLHAVGEDRKVATLIKAGILFKLIISVALSLLLFFFSEEIATHILKRPLIGPLLNVATIFVIGQSLLKSISSTFIGLDETGKSSLLLNIQAVIKALASPIFIISLGLVGALIAAGISNILSAAIGAIVLFLYTAPRLQRNSSQNENISLQRGLETMVIFGAPLYLSALIKGFQNQVRRGLLALYTSDINIGNYATATNFSALLQIIANPIAQSLFPAFSKLSLKEDREAIERMFTLSVKYTSLIIIPASMAIAVLSKEFIFFLYGSKYQEAPLYLMLNMLIFLSAGLGSVTINSLFNSQGDTKVSFMMSFINIILSIPLASIMIPLYNVQGLIASNIISLLISMSYGLYKMKKLYNIQLEWYSSFKIVTSSLLSSILVYSFLNLTPVLNPIYSLALGWGIYLISFLFFAPLFGAVEVEDLNILEGLIIELPLIYPLLKLFLKIERKIVKARNGALKPQAKIRMTTHGD